MQSFFYSFCCGLFARVDSTGGASVGASAAINAFIGIDFVDIAFRDSVGGTFAHASAASNTIIANNVSHSFEFKKLILIVSVSGKSTAFLFLDKLNWIFFDGECFFDKSFSSLTGNISMFFAFYSYFRKTIEKDIIHMGMFCCRRFGIGAATKVAALAVRRPAAYSFRFFCRYACAGFGYPAYRSGNRRRRDMVCRSTLFLSRFQCRLGWRPLYLSVSQSSFYPDPAVR